MSLIPEVPEVAQVLRTPLLEVDPDLGRHLSDADAEQARAALTLPLCRVPAGPLDLAEYTAAATNPFGAYVVSGLLIRELDLGGQPAVELLGPGDMFCPSDPDGSLEVHTRVRASGPTEIALLDDRLLVGARHFPRLVPALVQRLCEQHERLATQLVISHQPRVEDRLLNLFRHLADRFGQVTVEGVTVSVALTHEMLGRLVGARRPTVTLALSALESRGVLSRRSDRSWLLTEWPQPAVQAAA